MQTQTHKDVVKNITSAAQLEGELQLSQAQHGVAVLDVYNAEWGHCKALSETFRRLATDAGDMVHLRFFSVECNAVLESLRSSDDSKAPPRPKGMEFSPETLVAFWSKVLEQRQNHSKPYFAFYKEGKMRTHLEGIDTPKICRIVHDLCKQQNAAAEYITNQDALHFWESNFSPSENEVGMNEFVHAVRTLLGAEAADLSGDDLAHITATLHSTSGEVVTASSLQSFTGDTGTVRDALLAAIAARRAETGAPTPPAPAPAAAATAAETHKATAQRAPSPHPEEVTELDDGGANPQEEGAEDNSAHLASREEEAVQDTEELAEEEAAAPAAAAEAGDDYDELDSPAAPEADALHSEEVQPSAPAAAADVLEIDENSAHYPEEKEEDAVAASAIADSSAPPPDVPGGASAERDRDLEVTPSSEPSAPQEAEAATADTADTTELSPSSAPTPLPSPPHGASHAVDDEADEAAAAVSTSPTPIGTDGSPDSVDGAAEQDESTINQIFTNRWVTVSEEEMHVWNTVAALPLHYPESTTLMADLSNDATAAREALPASPATFPTLAEYLATNGVPFADVNMMCIAADQKVGSESLSYGKLSLILMSCDSEVGKGLVPECELFLGELSAGTLLRQHQPLAFTALALSASEAYPDECFYYTLPEGTAAAFQELSENDIFILNALTPLNTAAPPAGVFALRIIGLPKVIELATTDESDDTMVLSQWFARLRVVEQGADAITVHFVENACDDEFQGFLSGYIARLIEDENHLDKKQGEVPAEAAEEVAEDGEGEAAYEIGDDEGGEEDAAEYEEDAEVDDAHEL